jgi:hypothetical protein
VQPGQLQGMQQQALQLALQVLSLFLHTQLN